MNVREINPESGSKQTLAYYIESSVGLTLLTSWLVVALQKDSPFHPSNSTVLQRVLWPLFYAYGVVPSIIGWLVCAICRPPRGTRATDEERS